MSLDQSRNNDNLDMPSSPVAPNSASDRDSRGEHEAPLPPPPADVKSTQLTGEARERLEHVLGSDIGINTLLNRLKQSVSSARDYSSFLKERALVEEKHAQSLKRLARGTLELVRRPESRQGTYASCFEEATRLHDRMADNGAQFASSLNHMYEELQETIANIERSRKHWKQTGLESEKRVADAENAMMKAKGRYSNLAEQYDRTRTGEKSGGKFGIKGHKSAAQQEEDLHRKVEAADGEYAVKVQQAQAARQDLVTTHRPQAIRALQALIKECDAALGMQVTKYAGLSEKLLLGNGICISPLKGQGGPARSLRDIAGAVDNEKDFNDYVLSFAAKAGQNPAEIKYEKHPSLSSKQQMPHQPPQSQHPFESSQPAFGTPERTNTGYNDSPYSHVPSQSQSGQVSGVMPANGDRFNGGPQQPPYGNGPYVQSPVNNSPLPQLPPIGAMSLSDNHESKPEPGAGTPTRSPTHPQFDQGQQGRPSMDPYGPGFGQQAKAAGRPSMDAFGSGVGQQGKAAGRPSMDAYGPGSSGPPTLPAQQQQQSGGPPAVGFGGPGFHPNSRGPSMDSHGPASRGPSMGQPGAPVYAPQTYQPQPENNGPSAMQQKGNGVTSPSVTSPTGAAAMLPSGQRRTDMSRPNLPPLRPVFGVSLDEIFRRDGSAVPQIVYECVKAVDMYGLETEGIYRTSGSAPNIMQMKAQFDHGKPEHLA
jgi:Rho GTPase-activating protein RGD1